MEGVPFCSSPSKLYTAQRQVRKQGFFRVYNTVYCFRHVSLYIENVQWTDWSVDWVGGGGRIHRKGQGSSIACVFVRMKQHNRIFFFLLQFFKWDDINVES